MFSLRRIKSETSLAPVDRIGHVNLTTHELSALFSRMACSEAQLREVTSSSPSKLNASPSALSTVCLPSSRVLLRQPQLLSSPFPCESNFAQTELVRMLFSLPLMETILNIAKRYTALGIVDGLEDELLFALNEAIRDPSSPWSKLMPKPPPVVGPRTPEQYLCALDMAITARKETKRGKKITKYWKHLALQASLPDEDILLTPSPSDISDTGLSELLSSPRKDRVKELMAKRRTIAPESAGNRLNSDMIAGEKDDITRSRLIDSDQSDSSDPFCSDSACGAFSILSVSQESATASVDALDRTFIESKGRAPSALAKTSIPLLIRRKALPFSATSPPEDIKILSRPRKLLKSQNCYTQPESTQATSRRMSNIALTSVQTKRRMYESLASSPSPSLAFRIPSSFASTQTPIANPRPVPVHRTNGTHPRKVLPKSTHSSAASVSPSTIVAKPAMNTQRIASLASTRRGTSEFRPLTLLSQARHKSMNSHFGGKLPTSVPLSEQAGAEVTYPYVINGASR